MILLKVGLKNVNLIILNLIMKTNMILQFFIKAIRKCIFEFVMKFESKIEICCLIPK